MSDCLHVFSDEQLLEAAHVLQDVDRHLRQSTVSSNDMWISSVLRELHESLKAVELEVGQRAVIAAEQARPMTTVDTAFTIGRVAS